MRLYILALLVVCAVVQVRTSDPLVRNISIKDLIKENPSLLETLRSVKSESKSPPASPPSKTTTTTTTTPATTTASSQSTIKEGTARNEYSTKERSNKTPRRRRLNNPRRGRRPQRKNQEGQSEPSQSNPVNARFFPVA